MQKAWRASKAATIPKISGFEKSARLFTSGAPQERHVCA